MRVLVVSDLHGDLDAAVRARNQIEPDLILSCGDWGDPDQVSEAELAKFFAVVPVYTTFGNHDPLELLARLKNRDGSPILIPSGTAREFAGLRIAAIGGIWAKSHAKAHYVTDADVAEAASQIARSGPVDILISHASPIGLADLTAAGRHGGQRCFLEAFKLIAPRLYLCGHLHVAQEHTVNDGRKVMNVGFTPGGSVVVIEFDARQGTIEARSEQLTRR